MEMKLPVAVPSDIPKIDAVDVVDIRTIGNGYFPDFMAGASDAPFVKVRGEEARTLAEAFRLLSPSKQMRCHIPSFGFRFFLESGEVAGEASVCWACQNIHGRLGGNQLFFEFDATAAAAKKLLAEAIRLTGIVPTV